MSLSFNFHSKNQQSLTVFDKGTKTMVAPCGRSFGKSTGACIQAFIHSWNSPGIGTYYIAPTYSMCMSPITLFEQVLIPSTSGLDKYIERVYKTTQRMEIVLKNKKSIIFKSGDNPGSLRSNNMISSIIYDECGEMDDDVLATTKTNILRWSSNEWGGYRGFFGTPKGFNFFYNQHLEARKNPKEYSYRHYTTYDNPMYTKEYVDTLYRQYCDEKGVEWANQEIYAEFTTLNNTVFRGLENCIVDADKIDLSNMSTRKTSMGVDVAAKRDESAFLVIDIDTHEILHTSVLYQADQISQYAKVIELWNEFNKPQYVQVDATNEIFFATDMQNYIDGKGIRNLYIDPIPFTRKNKPDMVSKCATMVSRGDIKIPRTEEAMKLISQMNTYEQKETKSGNIKTAASGRNKDDRVSSLLLACVPIEIDYGTQSVEVQLDSNNIMTLKERSYYKNGGY